MSRITIGRAGEGFRCRSTSGTQTLSHAGGPLASQDEATCEAAYFRQSVTFALVVSVNSEVPDAPLLLARYVAEEVRMTRRNTP